MCIASLSIHQYQMPLKVVVEEEHVFLVFVLGERTVFPLSISLVHCSISELRFRRFNSWWFCAEYLRIYMKHEKVQLDRKLLT